MRVKIKFIPQYREAMLAGTKTMVCRLDKSGDPQDWFTAFGANFILTHVLRTQLLYVRADCVTQEGFDSREAFDVAWKRRYTSMAMDGSTTVWAHMFRRT